MQSLRLVFLLSLIVVFPSPAEDLSTFIDAAVSAKAKEAGVALAPKSDDAEFLRRVHLDLAGLIPDAATAKAFLSDTASDKRTKLIDKLLAAETYPTRMAELFHIHFMERLGDNPDWTTWLTKSFAANKPWDRMAKEILRADHRDEPNRGASFFIAKRLEHYGQNPVEYSALTRDVGRLFLGKNLQCAECHDHLFIDEYKQAHFQGLHQFFANTMLVDDKLQVGEKPTTEKARFASVFKKVEMFTSPALPGGPMVELPVLKKEEVFLETPDKKTKNPGVLRFSPLKEISERLPTADNRDFARNFVNRIWFAMLGRGLVHPLDLHHSENPASHPAVLDKLADAFVEHKFDIKWLVREIAMTEMYQRSGRIDGKQPVAELFAVALEKRLSAEQLWRSMTIATGTKHDDKAKAKFLKAFANPPREPEEDLAPSLKAALFVSYDDALNAMLEPKPGTLVERLAKEADDTKLADELFLAVLTRKPTTAEKDSVAKILKEDDRTRSVARLAWAMLAGMEFTVNH